MIRSQFFTTLLIRSGILLMLLLGALPLHAEDWSFDEIHAHPKQFAAGLTTGILLHEMGHVAVAKAKGYDVGLDGLSIVYPNAHMSNADHLQVASAGFQAQWLTSEIVLLTQEHAATPRKLDNFSAGLVCSHLAITAAYLVVLKNQPQGDITGIANATGWSRDAIAAYIAVPAALDYWRLTGHHVPDWVPALSLTSKGIGIAKAWTF